jgi:hypothetical protein
MCIQYNGVACRYGDVFVIMSLLWAGASTGIGQITTTG